MSLSMTLTRTVGRFVYRTPTRPTSRRPIHSLDPYRCAAPPPMSLRRRCFISRIHTGGRPALRLDPVQNSTDIEVVYLHGGGYLHPLSRWHWDTIARVIARTGAAVTVPSYGLAPQHTVDQAIPVLDSVYRQVVDAADGRRLVLMGDSSGGALAVAQAIRARDEGLRAADRIVLLSPWVDASLTNPTAKALERRDIKLRCDTLVEAARHWAGERETTDPMISPINDTLADLPAMTIYQGGHDILRPDVRLFAAKARAAGTRVDMREAPDGFHVYTSAFWTPEGRAAWEGIRDAVRGTTADGLPCHTFRDIPDSVPTLLPVTLPRPEPPTE
ncbi:Acetyl esterase/lipase [Austwickia chelonae]|uniref:Alpha/beta hydrolase fold-3 domain-containing protein n=1 Tax=Austwickia chelonae NBRC 105200 TaxID=1184607 RepID=K6UNB1_9MICO|nr:alpha/beta hydrolase fold domain-containing protein [Austwickia chelonae]GAB78831.1 hypothetical protein AUCHE_17_00430 [Austwickia chelonae NBRC 105200]SEV84982.1 Acetyl esterase/lipase [Austwickia chelonae]